MKTTATELLEAGFTELICVTAPDAVISPNSNIKPQGRGKTPGKPGPNGWHGYDWRAEPAPSSGTVAFWEKNNANIGLRADYFPAIDIDCHDKTLSRYVAERAQELLGKSPCPRIGAQPKQLLQYQTQEPFRRRRLWVGNTNLIEMLGAGQQYLVDGVHPETGKPYDWPNNIPQSNDLAEITADGVDSFIDQLEGELDMLGWKCEREGGSGVVDRETVDQESLRGDLSTVSTAVSLLPNDNESFPGRDDYLRVGYAIKAAVGDADGLPLFAAWAEKWEGNDRFACNDPTDVSADWKRMKPPFEVGAEYLYDLAQSLAGFNAAGETFSTPPDIEGVSDNRAESTAKSINGGEATGPIQYSDAAVAGNLRRRFGSVLKMCEERECWMMWRDNRWSESYGKRDAQYKASIVCQEMSNHAISNIPSENKAETIATRLASMGAARSVADYAALDPNMRISVNDLDADPWLLNTPDGTYDLNTLKKTNKGAARWVSNQTSVAPDFDMATPVWDSFLDDVCQHDTALIDYMRRVFAFCLTGDKSEHALLFIYGPAGMASRCSSMP